MTFMYETFIFSSTTGTLLCLYPQRTVACNNSK